MIPHSQKKRILFDYEQLFRSSGIAMGPTYLIGPKLQSKQRHSLTCREGRPGEQEEGRGLKLIKR